MISGLYLCEGPGGGEGGGGGGGEEGKWAKEEESERRKEEGVVIEEGERGKGKRTTKLSLMYKAYGLIINRMQHSSCSPNKVGGVNLRSV